MNENKSCDIQDLLDLFEETLSPSDVLAAKLISQFTTAIVNERLRLHMNQTEFAKLIGVSQAQVSQWERGNYNFSLRKIAEIVSALNLDASIEVSAPALVESDFETFKPAKHTNNIIQFPVKTSAKDNQMIIENESDLKEM